MERARAVRRDPGDRGGSASAEAAARATAARRTAGRPSGTRRVPDAGAHSQGRSGFSRRVARRVSLREADRAAWLDGVTAATDGAPVRACLLLSLALSLAGCATRTAWRGRGIAHVVARGET